MRSSQLYIYLLIAFSGVSSRLQGTTDPLQMARKADSLALAGDYNVAALYYHKAAFFSGNTQSKALFLVRSAESLAELQRYAESIEILNTINTSGFPDSLT